MAWPKRERHVWASQPQLLKAWYLRRHDAQASGRCKGWYSARALEFEGRSLWSYQDGYSASGFELARFVRDAKGRECVLVQWTDECRWSGRACRQGTVMYRYPYHNGYIPESVPRYRVQEFEDHVGTLAWHTAQIEQWYGKWKRARKPYSKEWKMEYMLKRVEERRSFAEAFGLAVPALEAKVQAAVVAMKLGVGT